MKKSLFFHVEMVSHIVSIVVSNKKTEEKVTLKAKMK